ncbi:MAG: hypothetical protein MZV65_20590 [Chromatiales bacterium]|nr:hypothetical protein [Chromatiales bacterium]
MLVSNPGQVITQTQLLREIWGPTHARYFTTICATSSVAFARSSARDTDEPRYLRAEPGVGYPGFLDGRGD